MRAPLLSLDGLDRPRGIGLNLRYTRSRFSRTFTGLLLLAGALLLPGAYAAPDFRISEILFNPPGADLGAEAIELRGPPNAVISNDTYLVFVEGDSGGTPGVIQNVFELSGLRMGGNGFLLLLQKDAPYTVDPGATLYQNTGDDEGWGDGSGSSIDHRGAFDRLDLENGSFTCLLVCSPSEPDPGDSIDADTNGVPDGVFTSWTVLDTIGILDNSGAGDISYAALTFRHDVSAQASGAVVELGFSPSYVARQGNTSGSTAADWLVGDDLAGTLPDFTLGSGSDAAPASFAGAPLDHWGASNFGSPPIPGVILEPHLLPIPEGASASFGLRLNTVPASSVSLRLESDAETRMSLDGTHFFSVLSLTFSGTNTTTVEVMAIDDSDVEPTPHASKIQLQMQVASAPEYPTDTFLPDVDLLIEDNDGLLISELVVNPPGEDVAKEYIELQGEPGAVLDRVYLVGIEGDDNDDPGTVDVLLDLSGAQVGANGFLLILASDHPYTVPAEAGILLSSFLSTDDGALPNGSITFILMTTRDPPALDEDLDDGDNGNLEGLPDDAFLLDSVGWTDGGSDDLVFAEAVLDLTTATPDAAMRIGSNTWFRGSLGQGDDLTFIGITDGFYHLGTRLSPGLANRVGSRLTPLAPLSGVLDDPTNPGAPFHVLDNNLLDGSLAFTTFTGNANVVPATNLVVQAITNQLFELHIDPVGVGYATITVRVSDASSFIDLPLAYAASAAGRTNTSWLTGVSDASAALAIDDAYMLVGDDEGQVIRMYTRDASGAPVKTFDLNPFLALTDFEDGQPREVDIEGVTRSGDQVFWLGAHSHAEIGELRTNRWRLIATELSGQGTNTTLTYLGHYEHLRSDLIEWDRTDGHGRGAGHLGFEASAAAGVLPKSADGSGFNMEAFAMAPASTNTAFLCFRAPLVPATNRAYACIVPLVNLREVAIGGGGPGLAQFGAPIFLNLGCRGIRSMEGGTNGYLMVGGEVDNRVNPRAFRLFSWTGHAGDPVTEYDGDLEGINPEALVALPPPPWTPERVIQVLSDNGRSVYYEDGIIAKLLAEPGFKKFRLDRVRLGEVVAPSARIRSFAYEADSAGLTWCGPTGRVFRIQTSLDLVVPSWQNLSGPLLLRHPVHRYEWVPDAAVQRFFRVHDTGFAAP
jgi:hypothetical protein